MQIAAVETLVNDARHKQAELLDMFKVRGRSTFGRLSSSKLSHEIEMHIG